MKPISIRVENFQSIDALDLDIEGFTCVTGPSNIGKSAILRAVSNAILNKSVVGAVRKGKKFCTVKIGDLKWEKGEKVGRYWVPGEVDESGNPKPRDGIGQGQTEVTQMMGFRSVKVGDKYINPWFASQFSPVFLMEDSGPAVTDFISDIAHLESLQGAIIYCTRNRQRLLAGVKDKEEEIRGLAEKEASLSGVDNLLRAEKDLVSQLDSIDEYRARIAFLQKLIASIDSAEASITLFSGHQSVRVPKAPPDMEGLMRQARIWQSLEASAVSVSAVRKVVKVSVPDALDPSALSEALRLSRLLGIPDAKKSVTILEKVKNVKVPEAVEVDVAKLKRVASLVESARAESSAVSRLEREVAVPTAPPFGLDGPLKAARVLAVMASDRAAITELEEGLSEADEALASVEAELAAIPSCPTCGRAWAGSPGHVHA